MGSEATIELPLIDFSKIYFNNSRDGDEWNSVKTQVHQALTEFGFFRASMAGMSPDFRSSLFGSLDQLFDLPMETKLKTVSDKPFHGYIGHSPTMPLYESMAIPDAPLPQQVESFTNFLWPDQGNSFVCKNIEMITEKLHWLDQTVRKMTLESLGLEKYADDHLQNTKHLLRFAKYKGPETNESITGLATHVDKTSLSILYQNDVAGLELKTKSGEWIRVEQSPETFTIFVGEVFHAWTNGRLHAPYHKVMMTGNEDRYSLGLFSVPRPGYITKVPEELVDQEHPLLFKPFDYNEFLKYFFAGANSGNENALQTYCGANEDELQTFTGA